MSRESDSRRYRRRPDHGGNLQCVKPGTTVGWPQCPAPTAQRWFNARIRPYSHTYRDVWYKYLALGLVNEPDAGLLEMANAGWTNVDPAYGHTALDRESPWTLTDGLGAGIPYAGVPNDGLPHAPIDVADSWGFGWVLTYYWQLDLAKMLRRVTKKWDEPTVGGK